VIKRTLGLELLEKGIGFPGTVGVYTLVIAFARHSSKVLFNQKKN
jgi:membrane-bound ClpP family serine protease